MILLFLFIMACFQPIESFNIDVINSTYTMISIQFPIAMILIGLLWYGKWLLLNSKHTNKSVNEINRNIHNITMTSNENNQNTNNTANIVIVPFTCMDSRIANRHYQHTKLQQTIDQYKDDTNRILQQLSRILESILLTTSSSSSTTATVSEELLQNMYQKKITTLSSIYEHDLKVFETLLLRQFHCPLMLTTTYSPQSQQQQKQQQHDPTVTTKEKKPTSISIEPQCSSEQWYNRPYHHGLIRYYAYCRKKEQTQQIKTPITDSANRSDHYDHDDLNKKESDDDGDSSKMVSYHGYDTISQVMAHLVRDWCIHGQSIRNTVYGWCVEQLELYLPIIHSPTEEMKHHPNDNNNSKIRILVPGAGLGRLAFDIATSKTIPNNVYVEAMECSIVMASAAYTIFNGNCNNQKNIIYDNNFCLHPYSIDYFTNEVHTDNRYEQVSFPDIDGNSGMQSYISQGSLSYTVTEFTNTNPYFRSLIQKEQNSCSTRHDDELLHQYGYASIVTCYFIDTVTNIIDTIELIYKLLQPGGIWINIGPLQWHPNSVVPLTVNELKEVLLNMNINKNTPLFEILHWGVDDTKIPVQYRDDNTISSLSTTTSSTTKRTDNTNNRLLPPSPVFSPRYTRSEGYHPLKFVLRKKS